MTLPSYNIIPTYLQYSVDFNTYVLKLIAPLLGLAEVYNKVALKLATFVHSCWFIDYETARFKGLYSFKFSSLFSMFAVNITLSHTSWKVFTS